jgi:nucleotide-binding universal stress UspA family protein
MAVRIREEGVMLEWKKICCGTDFSESSRLAMLRGAELARRLEGELELVHVHMPPPAVGEVLAVQGDEVGTELVELEKTMAMWRGEAERLAGRPVRSTVLPGDAASEIVRFARERGSDLIVLGTHGRKGLKRLVLGSVAERVMREAPCAVLVVRRREPAEARAVAEEGAP